MAQEVAMTKRILITLILLSIASFTYSGIQSGVATWVPTDYTQDANCMGAWYMNSAGDASEIDRSGEGGDLAESAGDTVAQSFNCFLVGILETQNCLQ